GAVLEQHETGQGPGLCAALHAQRERRIAAGRHAAEQHEERRDRDPGGWDEDEEHEPLPSRGDPVSVLEGRGLNPPIGWRQTWLERRIKPLQQASSAVSLLDVEDVELRRDARRFPEVLRALPGALQDQPARGPDQQPGAQDPAAGREPTSTAGTLPRISDVATPNSMWPKANAPSAAATVSGTAWLRSVPTSCLAPRVG